MSKAGNLSSGDMIVDRRFEYARALFEDGDFVASADLTQQITEIAPLWPVGWNMLGDCFAKLGQMEDAAAAWSHCVTLAPGDALGAGLKRAALSLELRPDHPPEAYVRELFDEYATRFETELTQKLHYNTPKHLADLLAPLAQHHHRVLDLGCGTGLMGVELQGRFDELYGVDLSRNMVQQARSKNLYTRLTVGDVTAFLTSQDQPYDLIIAADVFVYVGALDEVFAQAARLLSPQGLFVASVEKAEEGFCLQPSLRYAHSLSYLDSLATRHGLVRIAHQERPLRMDRGVPIIGHLTAYRSI